MHDDVLHTARRGKEETRKQQQGGGHKGEKGKVEKRESGENKEREKERTMLRFKPIYF